MDKVCTIDRKTIEAALTLLELHKGDMAPTKLLPITPCTSSRQSSTYFSTSNAGSIKTHGTTSEDTAVANPEQPKTPRGSTDDREVWPGPYPTPAPSAEQPSKKVKPEDETHVKMLVKYGRWSDSGRSWFPNRRSVPGDRPPPQGAQYSYRPVYFNRLPILQARHSSVDSELTIARPRRRKQFEAVGDRLEENGPSTDIEYQPIYFDEQPTPKERHSSVASSADSEPIISRPNRHRLLKVVSEEDTDITSDASSVDSNPIIIRRRRRPLQDSSSAKTQISSYLTQQNRDSPLSETSLPSDLHARVQNRVRRRIDNLQRSSRAPRKLKSGNTKEYSIPLADSDETAPESPEDQSDSSSQSPPQRWVRRSRRRRSKRKPPRNPEPKDRMTLEEWVDEEDVMQLTPPQYESSGSEWEG
ncbi:MAG: hypothetical protein Q9195_007065 [Heterodermia aff. obscurata]